MKPAGRVCFTRMNYSKHKDQKIQREEKGTFASRRVYNTILHEHKKHCLPNNSFLYIRVLDKCLFKAHSDKIDCDRGDVPPVHR